IATVDAPAGVNIRAEVVFIGRLALIGLFDREVGAGDSAVAVYISQQQVHDGLGKQDGVPRPVGNVVQSDRDVFGVAGDVSQIHDEAMRIAAVDHAALHNPAARHNVAN